MIDINRLKLALHSARFFTEVQAIESLPPFMQPEGELGDVRRLFEWPEFRAGVYRDGEHHLLSFSGISPKDVYEMGTLLRSSNVDRIATNARRFCEDLAVSLGCAPDQIKINAWAVQRPWNVDWHFDTVDVLHIQLRGKKRLLLCHEHRVPFGVEDDARRAETMLDDVRAAEPEVHELGPGSVTFLPKGLWHRTQCGEDPSLALAVAIYPPPLYEAIGLGFHKRLEQKTSAKPSLLGEAAEKRKQLGILLDEVMSTDRELLIDSILLAAKQPDGIDWEHTLVRLRFAPYVTIEEDRIVMEGRRFRLPLDSEGLNKAKRLSQSGENFSPQEAIALRPMLPALITAGMVRLA